MYDWLDDVDVDSTTVITSSRRLARDIRSAYDRRRAAEGHLAWQTPDVLFWEDWLARTLETVAVADAPLLLPAHAATLLWEQCLLGTAPPDVLSIGAIVRHARQAWRRLHEWQVPLGELRQTAINNDERWFARAAAAYQERLRSGQWTDAAGLPASVSRLVTGRRVELPTRILGAGFDRTVPSLEALAETIRERGCGVHFRSPGQREPAIDVVSFADNAAQWRAVGADARRALQHDPDAKLAIIAPDLASGADGTSRLVREGLVPGWQLAPDRRRAIVDVSYGRRLGEYPLVAIALLCLRWTHTGLAGDEISILLRSSFIGRGELEARARVERSLRTVPDRRWRVTEFLAFCEQSRLADGALPIGAISDLQEQAPRASAPGDWARRFDAMLAALGWPGIERLDSDEFQLLNRWRQLLNDLAGIEVVRPAVSLGEAVRRLTQMAAETVYQPESRSGAVHLLGMMEAAGMEFDRVWLGGLDATRWPPPSQPMPLLPRLLQRRFDMPDATPEATLQFARHVFRGRVGAAAAVTLSWPQVDDDAVLAPSPLLATIAAQDGRRVEDPGWFATTQRGKRRIECLPNDPGPVVDSVEKIFGGAYTIQRQHENPFSAFASGRLGVVAMPAFQRGLTPRHRGSALHRALQGLLEDEPSRGIIASWSAEAQAERVRTAVLRALRDFERHADDVLQRLLAIEQRRMQSLLHDFLAEELRREDFAVVAVEERRTFECAPVSLRLRIDRIDRLADGSLLIIDYKSGRDRGMRTQSGDLADMQLGVYARAVEERIGGLLLINLDSRAIRYRGIGGSVPWGRVDADDWSELLATWMRRVDGLATALAGGDVRVNLDQARDRNRLYGVLSRIEELRRGE